MSQPARNLTLHVMNGTGSRRALARPRHSATSFSPMKWLRRRLRLVAIAGCFIAPPAAAQAAGSAPGGMAHVAVVGSDYAFIQFPATIAAGPTRFSFENRGNVRHEMSVVLLKAGVTVEDVM